MESNNNSAMDSHLVLLVIPIKKKPALPSPLPCRGGDYFQLYILLGFNKQFVNKIPVDFLVPEVNLVLIATLA